MTESAEYFIAHRLVAGRDREQEFWNDNWPVIELLLSAEAILETEIHTYKKMKTVNNALALIVLGDFVWQIIRELFCEIVRKKGSDVKETNADLKERIIQEIYGEKKGVEVVFFENEKKLIQKCLDDLQWLFDLHSSIRHPNADKLRNYPFLFGEWRMEDEERLIYSAKSSLEIVHCVCGFFTGGFAGEKATMAAIARSNQVKK